MSLQATIDIYLAKNIDAVFFCEKVLLANFSLMSREYAGFSYAPYGGEDDIEWVENALPVDELMRVVKQKAAVGERIIFSFCVRDGALATFSWSFQTNTAWFDLYGDRVCLAGTKWTDFSWYLKILVAAIGEDIISINCRDYH